MKHLLATALAAFAAAASAVELRTKNASCHVDLNGGRILSYVRCGREQLWMPEEPQAASGWRHGGIPVCWPWFGVNAEGASHGFAWRSRFVLEARETTADEDAALLSLVTNGVRLAYRVRLTDDRLRLELDARNDSGGDFAYTVAFHPYFRVARRDDCAVEGLDGLAFVDDPSFPNGTNGLARGIVFTTNMIDRIYALTGGVHACVLRERDGRARRLTLEGFTDVNVWNPEANPEFDGILAPGAWRTFLCVEPVRFGAGDEVVLAPGTSRRHSFTIEPSHETTVAPCFTDNMVLPRHVRNVSVVDAAAVCESNDIHPPTKTILARRIADVLHPDLLPGFAIDLFDGKTGTVSVTSREFAAPVVTRTDGTVRIAWKGHPMLGADFAATAEGVERGGATEWKFACAGNASGLPLGRIAFPVVDAPCPDRGHLLYSPDAGGGTLGWKKLVDWKSLAEGASVASTLSPGFRFVAVLNGEARDSYYLDVRDAAFNAGRFEVRKGPQGTARLAWVHDLPLLPANAAAYRLPFAATVRRYRGDWFAAAAFYREWMKTTPRFAAAKARDLSKLREVDLWMWNRGLAETVIPPVLLFQKETGLKVALDWYWWFKEMPGTFYPDYWPPREGPAKFKDDVQLLKRAGVFTQVYLNGMTWDEDAPSWQDGGRESVAMRRDGSYVSIAYNRFNPNHHLANLCGEAPKFQSRIRREIARLVDCGFDSIYLDMIGCNAYGPCFNPAHRHAPGGGTHMTDGFRAYLKAVRGAFPGLLLSTEDGSEAYADIFDSCISTHSSYERHGWIGTAPEMEFVPVFQAIHHGTIAAFGNYAIVDNVPYWDPRWPMRAWWTGHEEHLKRDFPDQFAVEFARGPAWGLQPSVHNFSLDHMTNAALAAEYRFVRETAKFYHENRAFLFDGEMCHPGRLVCARKKVAFAKVSVFDEHVTSHASELPTVFHNVWRAPDGTVAAILVNWTQAPQHYELRTPDLTVSGTLPPRSWRKDRQ